MKKTLHYLSIITLSVLSVIGVSYLQAWDGPSATPPDGNTPAPINVSDASQVKEGGLSLGSLLVNGGSIFNGLLKIPTNAGDGKVLTSDAEGNATWQESSSSDVLASQCVVASTNRNNRREDYMNDSGKRFWRVSLINSAGRNICVGSTSGPYLNSGCSYTVWRLKSDLYEAITTQSMYGSTNYFYRQLKSIATSEDWTDDTGSQRGINGDGVAKYFVNYGNNFYVYDDYSEGSYSENSENEWTIRADNFDYVWTMTICPAM